MATVRSTELDLPALRQLVSDVGGQVELYAGHLANPDHSCQCQYIFDGAHAGGIGQVFLDNGLNIVDGGNDCPDEDLARAYLKLLVGAANALPGLLDRLEELEDALGA